MTRVALALFVTAAALAVMAGNAHASTSISLRHSALAIKDVTNETSSNWAGYAVSSGASPTTFSTVSGAWTEPTATCTRGAASYSAFWVGLGGFADGSQALEQTGTEADCSANGRASYSVWYELVPAAPVTVQLTVQPGDAISANVSVSGQAVTLTVANTTRGTNFTTQLTMATPDLSSAEWIAEAPSSCIRSICRALPLTNFGTVSFTGSSATGNGHVGTISDPAWAATSVLLQSTGAQSLLRGRFASPSPVVSAVPAALSSDGSSFSVSWQQSVPAAPSRPTFGNGRGRRWGL